MADVKRIHAQTQFTTGQISFRIRGRTDIDKYSGALEEIINYRVLPQGPLELRNGTIVINRVKDSTNPPRLLRFIVSTTQSFILEFGDKYLRFYISNGLVADSSNPTQPFELVTPYTLEQIFELQFSQSEFDLIMTHKDVPQQQLTFLGAGVDDWEITEFIASPPPTFESGFFPDGTLTATAETGLGITFTSTVGNFSGADVGRAIEGVDFPGIASIKTFTNVNNVVADILIDFDVGFSLDEGEWLLDLSPLIDLTFNDISRVGGIVTVGTSPNTNNVFKDSFIGDYILVNDGVLQIITIDPTGSSCECEILKSMSSTDDSGNWTLEKPTWDEIRGFPSTVTQAQQRLLFAASKAQPQTIWPSEVGIINGFGIGSEPNDSFEIDVQSNEIATINWMNTARDIIIGTTGGESTINISSTTLSNPPEITQRSAYRSDKQSSVVIGNEVLFIQIGGRKILTYFFDFSTDTFKADELTFFSEDITKSGIVQIAYAQEPNKQILAVTKDGTLLSGTFDRLQNVTAFTEYVTDGKFLSVQTIPEGQNDQVWVVVEREVNGVKNSYVEIFDESDGTSSTDVFTDSSVIVSNPISITSATNDDNCRFSTSGIAPHGFITGDKIIFKKFSQWKNIDQIAFTVVKLSDFTFECGYDSSQQPPYDVGGVVFKTITKITGLTHLEGKEVVIKVDNGGHKKEIVQLGEVDLNPDADYAEAVVGLEYIGTMTTLPPEFDGGIGTMQAEKKSLNNLTLRVDNSFNPIVNGISKPSQSEPLKLDQAKPLFTGDLSYNVGSWGLNGVSNIQSVSPFPLRILALYGSYNANYK